MIVRKPTDDEYPQIYEMLDKAFIPSSYESMLVKNLKEKDKISYDFILEGNGVIEACICYSAAYSDRKEKIGYHLAPVAISPEKQNQGLGRRTIAESMRIVGDDYPVYVLGSPTYYTGFGFKIDKTQKCAFDPSGEHFMVAFSGSLSPGDVLYEDEFMS